MDARMREIIQRKWKSSRQTLNIGIYLVVLAVIWSPYFTPSGEIDPAGLLRADQVLIPLLIIGILLSTAPNVRILYSFVSLLLASITVIIFISYLIGVFVRGYPAQFGDIFDVLIWATYTAIIAITCPFILNDTSRKIILFLIVASIGASLLALLQYFDIAGVNSLISPVFTDGIHLTRVAQQRTGPAGNTSVIAQLLTMQLLVRVALAMRSIDTKTN
jgi:energy-converting hydrogenase Eha subunit C